MLLEAAVAEAVKKWDGGRSLRGGVWGGASQFWESGCYRQEFFLENIGANLCNLVHFRDIRS